MKKKKRKKGKRKHKIHNFKYGNDREKKFNGFVKYEINKFYL